MLTNILDVTVEWTEQWNECNQHATHEIFIEHTWIMKKINSTKVNTFQLCTLVGRQEEKAVRDYLSINNKTENLATNCLLWRWNCRSTRTFCCASNCARVVWWNFSVENIAVYACARFSQTFHNYSTIIDPYHVLSLRNTHDLAVIASCLETDPSFKYCTVPKQTNESILCSCRGVRSYERYTACNLYRIHHYWNKINRNSMLFVN